MVNTFIPYTDFKKIARVLDTKRLGKQRVEAKQILNILLKHTEKKGFINHPIVFMWRGHEQALKLYYNTMIDEWIRRGYVNNMKKYRLVKTVELPWFMFSKPILMSHRASLLRKNPKHYSKYFKAHPSYLKHSYIWIAHLNPEQISKLKQGKKITINEFAKEHL